MQHQFFHGFVPQQEVSQRGVSMTPELQYNLMVIELYNNWTFVQDLIDKAQEGGTINVDLVQKDWVEFINKNNIDIKSYENEEDFMEKHLKPLVKNEN